MAIWLLARALRRGSVRAGLGSGLAAGCMVAGRDQIAFLCMLVLTFYAAWTILDGCGVWRRLRQALAPLAMGFLGGIVTGALPIAFSIALATQSNRPAIDYVGAARGSLHPAAFLTAVAADLYGTAGPMTDYWGPPSPDFWGANDLVLARNMGDLYAGALPFVLLVGVGLLGARCLRREVLVFTLAALLLALYALGGQTGFFSLAFRLPGVDLFRRPADATFPLCALASFIAGYCLQSLRRDRGGRWIAWAPTVAVVLGLSFALGVTIEHGKIGQSWPALATAAFFLTLSSVTIEFVRRRPVAAYRTALLVVAGLLAWDLAISNAPNESTGLPPSTYDVLRPGTANTTIVLLEKLLASEKRSDRRDRVELAAIDFQWPNASLVHGFEHDLGYNPIRLKLFEDVTHAEDQVAVPEQRVFSPLFPSYRSSMADLFGLRYVATGVPAEQIDHALHAGDLRLIARTPDAYVYENPNAFPRVFVAAESRVADFDAMVRTGVWPDVDLHRTVLLERPPEAQASVASDSSGQASLTDYRNTRIDVAATAPATGGWLVLLDVWHPWWSAEVDGREVPIERADAMFRAIRLPPGEHKVVFSFQPFRGLLADVRRWLGFA